MELNNYKNENENEILSSTKKNKNGIFFHEKSKIFYLNILKIKIVILLTMIFIIIYKIYFNIQQHIVLDNITHKENFTSRVKAWRKGKKYLTQCLKGSLIKKQKFQISKDPKVTIIIPIYNTGELIKLVIRSIQNQNIQDIEIILINDYSNDNNITLQIIEKLKKEDPRIVIINNHKNMGILYSRCIGVLQSKGEYIMNLDHDDFIFDEDVFDTTYKSAKMGNFDIISFTYVISKDYSFKMINPWYFNIPHNYIVTQPRLSSYPLFTNDEFRYHDYTIWAKLYENLMYKKAVNYLTLKRYSVFNTYNEDLIGLFIICNVADNYKYIRKYGVYHKDYINSTSHIAKKEKAIYDDIFFSEIILDLGKNQFKKYGAIFLNERVKLSNNKNNKYLLEVIKKIFNCKYIGEKYKKEIKNNFGNFIIYKAWNIII